MAYKRNAFKIHPKKKNLPYTNLLTVILRVQTSPLNGQKLFLGDLFCKEVVKLPFKLMVLPHARFSDWLTANKVIRGNPIFRL